MTSFESDYNNGVVPEILKRFSETNDERTSGYGFDPYTESAKRKIREAIGMPEADICFLIGGTQTNSTVIDSMIKGCEGVISSTAGHINVHEAGAIEAFGHKVITINSDDGRLSANDIEAYMQEFYSSDTYPHMVQPGMVYITLPTELGLLYSRSELHDIYAVCRKYGLYLYIDGARLGYGLMSPASDIDLPSVAHSCDVFYIGGTKVGAMFGEAVVYTGTHAPKQLFSIVKSHGALLAKGRMLGIQFDTLFTDSLYFRISRHADEMAVKLRDCFSSHGYSIGVNSPTNQQFIILSPSQIEALKKSVVFEIWQKITENRILCRFVTSWATTEEDINVLDKALNEIG